MSDEIPEIPASRTSHTDNPFSAVILAGAREEQDELRAQEKEDLKAFIKVGGTPMIDYVLKAVLRSGSIDDIYICMNEGMDFADKAPLLAQCVKDNKVKIVPAKDGPSASVTQALSNINDNKKVVITTADHPLLTRAILKEFLQKSSRSGSDATLGIIPTDIIEHAYPNTKRTRLKFREGGYTGCNLFTLLTPKARQLPEFWEDLEAMRKKPLNLAGFLGPITLTQYLTGLLSLDGALEKISRKTGISMKTVRMHQPEAGIDVDTPEDLSLVKEIIQNY